MGRVALIGDNSPEYVSLILDIWNTGNSVVLLDKNIPYQKALATLLRKEIIMNNLFKDLFTGIVEPKTACTFNDAINACIGCDSECQFSCGAICADTSNSPIVAPSCPSCRNVCTDDCSSSCGAQCRSILFLK